MATSKSRSRRTKTPATPDSLVAEFDAARPLYVRFEDKIERLVDDLADSTAVKVHSVTGRVKDHESLARKLTSREVPYERLDEVTDLAGVRVITYFNVEVAQLGKAIEDTFKVDWPNSSDRSATLQPDQFGYLSVHYVVSISSARAALPEWRFFKGLKCEIQVRSILQHAWAEIEHDLGYKSPVAVPAPVRRRFSRLAGLLELADDEFAQIRRDLDQYVARVQVEAVGDPAGTQIDAESMAAYIDTSELVRSLDQEIANVVGGSVNADPTPTYAARRAEDMVRLNLGTLDEVDDLMTRYGPMIPSFVSRWIPEKDRPSDPPKGSSVWFAYLLASAALGDEGIDRVMASGSLSRGAKNASAIDARRGRLAAAYLEATKGGS